MAFVKKSGSRYEVRQGNTGVLLSTHSSKKEAEKRVSQLHRTHKPSASNRGKRAAKDFRGQKLPRTKVGNAHKRRSGRRSSRHRK